MNTALAGAVAGKHLKEQQEQKEDALLNDILKNHENMVESSNRGADEEAKADIDAALNAAPGEDWLLKNYNADYDLAVEARAQDISINRLRAYYNSSARQTELAYAMGKVSYEKAMKVREKLLREYVNTNAKVFAGMGILEEDIK